MSGIDFDLHQLHSLGRVIFDEQGGYYTNRYLGTNRYLTYTNRQFHIYITSQLTYAYFKHLLIGRNSQQYN